LKKISDSSVGKSSCSEDNKGSQLAATGFKIVELHKADMYSVTSSSVKKTRNIERKKLR
jgi:hypothetical protein